MLAHGENKVDGLICFGEGAEEERGQEEQETQRCPWVLGLSS